MERGFEATNEIRTNLSIDANTALTGSARRVEHRREEGIRIRRYQRRVFVRYLEPQVEGLLRAVFPDDLSTHRREAVGGLSCEVSDNHLGASEFIVRDRGMPARAEPNICTIALGRGYSP